MAKSKVSENDVDGVEPVGTQQAVNAFRFELIAGRHVEGEVIRETGDVIESDDDLVAIHGSTKFRRLE